MKELDKLDVSADELQPFRFQGQMFDVETGLHYNRFRYYDNDVGMFIQRDPIGLMGGNNIFAYAPNPVGLVDPLGLFNYPSKEIAIKNLGIKPDIPARYFYGRDGTERSNSAQYSDSQKKLINIEWNRIVQNDINQHLAAGRMLPCPRTEKSICSKTSTNSWRRYGGVSQIYHCGFNGYMENRKPTASNPAPTNECFYDREGNLVDEKHKYSGCRGTPDYYPSDGLLDANYNYHMNIDPGGPEGPSSKSKYKNLGEEGKAGTARFYSENPLQKNPPPANSMPRK